MRSMSNPSLRFYSDADDDTQTARQSREVFASGHIHPVVLTGEEVCCLCVAFSIVPLCSVCFGSIFVGMRCWNLVFFFSCASLQPIH